METLHADLQTRRYQVRASGYRMWAVPTPRPSFNSADPVVQRLSTAQERQSLEFSFGPFCLLPRSRTLLLEGRPIECGSRAFDLLHVLLMFQGQIVSKDTIVKHVWPTTCVEESNLRFQMASLRKTLGPHRDLIKTIPGRGYLLATA